MNSTIDVQLARAVTIVALANLAYFAVEMVTALAIGSVSLFADSIDFLEDASLNLLVLLALRWSLMQQAKLGMVLAALLLVPGFATLWMAWEKFHALSVPHPLSLTLVGMGALAVNLGCAFLLARFRNHKGSLTKAAFLSARNDAIANVAIIAAGLLSAVTLSGWPDLVVGLAIAAMNADAAREVWVASRSEYHHAKS